MSKQARTRVVQPYGKAVPVKSAALGKHCLNTYTKQELLVLGWLTEDECFSNKQLPSEKLPKYPITLSPYSFCMKLK